jgi:mRNA-degrading endonuclease RelE of RelBE toxin-antitoxin system
MEFIEAPTFTRRVLDYLDGDEYQSLQNSLVENPDLGDLMPGTGGFRKIRWADARRGKGRRGGLRIIYYYFLTDQQIWLMTLYDKDEASDLTPAQKKMVRAALDAELRAREKKRSAQKGIKKGRVR